MDQQERHAKYIAANWPQLAALAWRGYLQEGRGSVVTDQGQVRSGSTQDERYVLVYYISEAVLRERGAWPQHPACEAIEAYDPEQEIVIIFRLPGGEQPVYKICIEDLTPPQAFALSQDSRPDRL